MALVAIMSLYGIELLEDNIIECRKRLLSVFSNYLKIEKSDEFYRAAYRVLTMNLVHGDALKMCTSHNRPIIFSEWEYLGKGKFCRRDFRFDLLIQASEDKNKTLLPIKVYDSITVNEIALSPKSIIQRVVA